jgi:hypothetical protein
MAISSDILPLVGVGMGVVLSWGTNVLSERSRFARERSSRLQEQRLATCVDFSVAAKESMSILFRVAASRGVDAQTEPLSAEEAAPLLADAFHRREAAAERLRLITDDEIFSAARRWVEQIYVMRSAVVSPDLDRARWQELVGAANEARTAFHVAARRDLQSA